MDLQQYLTFLAALVFVLALIMLGAWMLRRLGLGHAAPAGGKQRRLSLVEVMPLDPKRRLVLVRRDDVEHLILLGAQGETVVETGIHPPAFREAVAAAQSKPTETAP